ncbi:hypothetical protein F5Y16DRAFT_216484 [Xylariaceae sp. FL0255]|nr:hypothetical protein F5Y16DRAFT_216484 [Xylariaceae sp. FL0255]
MAANVNASREPIPVLLIPFDPNSQEHLGRMKLQRIACGWKVEEVDSWPEKQRKGIMGLHWVVLPPGYPRTEEWLKLHFNFYPNEVEALVDTCTSVLGREHKPDPLLPFFHPIGHISLDSETYEGSGLLTSLSDGILSLMCFFISRPLQNFGLGGAALDAVERIAREQFKAKVITLATIANEDCAPDSPRRIAMKRPIPKITNHDWYERRGFKVYSRDLSWNEIDDTGKEWVIRGIRMRKDLQYGTLSQAQW